MASFHHLAEGITCHAWNKDKSMLAICPNTNEIVIYSDCLNADSRKWKKQYVLTEHDMVVSGLDWSPITNRIVSCSHDRNAFVWTFTMGQWKPSLVLLRINRAALNVKWSPDGKKFAVASGAKCVPVCYYQPQHDWWISKTIKKHKSSVIDLEWHPNSQLIATACSDFKCRVFSAFVADTDNQPNAGPFPEMSPFGELMAEFDNARGWVEAVGWSPKGDRLAFAGHDASIHIVHFGKATPTVQSIRFQALPLQRVLFLSNDAVVGGGNDFNILLFTCQNEFWSYSEMLEKRNGAAVVKSNAGGFSAARNMWESKVSKGQSSEASTSDKGILWTKHESAITYLAVYEKNSNGNVSHFTSSGLDGRIVHWKLDLLSVPMAKLKI